MRLKARKMDPFLLPFLFLSLMVGLVVPAQAEASTVYVWALEPSWTANGGGGVFSAYVGPPDYGYVSPGTTEVYDGREGGIIKAGLTPDPDDGHYWDEGLFAFIPTVTIDQFADSALTYHVVNQEGTNPVWMTIEIDTGVAGDRSDNTTYQFVPTTNPSGWHTFDAAAGEWQQWADDNGTPIYPSVTLSEIAAANSGLDVVRTYLRLGMGDSYHGSGSGTVAWVDRASIGGVTYDFVCVLPDGADRLVETQNTDGGWGWPLTGTSAPNTIGPIAMGLAQSYGSTLDLDHKAGLELAGGFLLAKRNTFSPSDGYLAATLDRVFGGTTYADHVKTYFYDALAAGTYDRNGAGTLYDTAGYVQMVRDARASQGIANLAAWDIGMGLVGAVLSGADVGAWVDGTEAEINELDGTGYYDVVGLAGAVYGLAAAGQDFNPFAGQHAAASSLSDLADILAGYQLTTGGFTWNSLYLGEGEGNESNQETAYALLALNEVDRAAYLAHVSSAEDYLVSVQLPTGGWDGYVGDPYGENNEITGEALWAIVAARGCTDADGDGYGDPVSLACAHLEPDCNDAEADVNPGAIEIEGNGKDDDCNPETQDCVDADGDGYGSPASSLCDYPEPDCDDADPDVNPGATEILRNGIDDDCNPGTPETWGAASVAGAGQESLSGVVNHLALLLLPLSAIAFWRARRRRD
ncbi:MAG: MopE-related protein [bacterium]